MSSSFLPNKVNNVTIKKSFPTAINVLSLNFCFYNKQKKKHFENFRCRYHCWQCWQTTTHGNHYRKQYHRNNQ